MSTPKAPPVATQLEDLITQTARHLALIDRNTDPTPDQQRGYRFRAEIITASILRKASKMTTWEALTHKNGDVFDAMSKLAGKFNKHADTIDKGH